eukprot:COSAG05_NODE_130_length_17165_cov_154.623638_14_plen_61_part_00
MTLEEAVHRVAARRLQKGEAPQRDAVAHILLQFYRVRCPDFATTEKGVATTTLSRLHIAT